MKSYIDAEAARELVLYADNTSRVYFNSILPTIENLRRKVKRGTYDKQKAVKAFGYVAEYAAKEYAREFATPEQWHVIFNAATRRAAAAELLETNTEQIVEG